VEALAESLTVALAGKVMTVREVFELHSPAKLYVKRNYKEALMQLEADGRVTPSRLASERRQGTLADDIKITFPRLTGTGVRMASRSTLDRQGPGLRPSASVRPTA
jgi:hypothetical protein